VAKCHSNAFFRDADTAVLDAGDVYTAGYHYGLIPVMAEIYNTKNTKLGEPEYYAVAVAYQGDPDTELTYLKGSTTLKFRLNYAPLFWIHFVLFKPLILFACLL